MTRGSVLAAAALLALGLSCGTAVAQEQVEKRVFEAGAYQTRGGGTIANARVGYQTMGRLNAAGDNAVLIAHFFSGNSHAFGRLGGADGPVGWREAGRGGRTRRRVRPPERHAQRGSVGERGRAFLAD